MNYRDGQKQRTNWPLIVSVAIIAFILFGAVGYFVGSKAMPGNSQYDGGLNVAVPGIEADNSAIPAYAGPPVTDQPLPPLGNTAQPYAVAPTNPMDGSVAQDDGSVIDDNGDAVPSDGAASGEADHQATSADRQGNAEIATAINNATKTALEQGGSVSWKKDGLSGEAVASAATVSGDLTCRNVYATTLRDDGETRGPSVRWCRAGEDGEWQRR